MKSGYEKTKIVRTMLLIQRTPLCSDHYEVLFSKTKAHPNLVAFN